jgi:hypothetical protein
MKSRVFLNALAHAFLSGEVTENAIRERARQLLGREWPWLRPVIRRYVQKLSVDRSFPRRRDVAEFIAASRFFQFAWSKFRGELAVGLWIVPAGPIVPRWGLPPLRTHMISAGGWDWTSRNSSGLRIASTLMRKRRIRSLSTTPTAC